MKATGTALIALAVLFNLPFARLAATFDYPDILREPTEAILAAFNAGGTDLVATWYAFAFAAILMVPVSLAHAFAKGRLAAQPEWAISAALLGVLAGLLQAMGLLRWVLVVPALAAANDTQGFALIHAYSGMALGEHLGMLLTAGHVALMALIQRREATRILPALGALAALMIGLGAFEGPALALGLGGAALGLSAMLGYVVLSLWLAASGAAMLQNPSPSPALA